MLFQTSTPKKRTLTPLPRSSTPKTFSNLIKDNYHQADIVGDKSCRPTIKLDSLLYRPKAESHHHHHRQHHKQQSWDV